ncbi:EF-hand calcium-binding domain-containing protein 9-like [Paramisgurnus dabryanus]|uniref:EF-hand calcium-binding domain-containing protein 9-like n=1 Tax=Paramisgurnus dabryanus TaxID=90735 RepID=UPI0031F42854
MKLKTESFLHHLDFNTDYCIFSLHNTKIIYDYFCLLDVHNKRTLNDVQFCCFMRHVTDMGMTNIMQTFDLLDANGDGEIGFNEFYMLVCILVSSKQHVEQNFLDMHSRQAFDLLDTDGSGAISLAEFECLGYLFNLKRNVLRKTFLDFDISGDKRLIYKEFRVFTKDCMTNPEKYKKKGHLKQV